MSRAARRGAAGGGRRRRAAPGRGGSATAAPRKRAEAIGGERIRDPERARRLARWIFWDILAYHRHELRLGLEKDDVFERLRGPLEAARVFYRARVDPALPEAERIFAHALVDVLFATQRHVLAPIW